MRILIVSEFFRPYIGGIEVLTDHLLPVLVRKGHDVHALTSHGPMPLADEESFAGVRVWRHPFRAVIEGKDAEGMLRLRRRLALLIDDLAPDVIHLHGVGPSLILLLPMLSTSPARVLLQLHQRVFSNENARESLMAQVVQRADWVVSVSASALAQTRQLFPEITERSAVLPNAVPAPALLPSPLPFAPPRLLCLGRLTTQKGFDLALRAVAVLAPRFPDVRVVIAGDGDERPVLEGLAGSLGIAAHCNWKGWVSPANVPAVINESTMVILSSRYEGMPLVAIEAGWMGRPAVASRVDGIGEVIRHEETGILVEPENVDELAAGIERLLQAPEETRRMGAAARAVVEREFGWEKCVAAYDDLYLRLGTMAARPSVVV